VFICLRPPPLLGFCLGSCTVAVPRQEPKHTNWNWVCWKKISGRGLPNNFCISSPFALLTKNCLNAGFYYMPDLFVVVLTAPVELAAAVLLLLMLRLRVECCLVLVSQCGKTPSRNNRQDG
jgi:hypothetical protein